jgi:two-component system CheB/CheR fusion protein
MPLKNQSLNLAPMAGSVVEGSNAPPSIPMTVGIGASAGGHEALEQIFTVLPVDCGLSFVVIMHLPAEGPSLLADILRSHTALQVLTVEDGMPLHPRTVHVAPPGKDLIVDGGRLRFVAPETVRPHHPIDRFFASLAADLGQCAIAVVLSGFGADGAEGVKRVKEEGGIVLVQDPETAVNPFMPQNAIATGAADSILVAAEIGHWLARTAGEQEAFPAGICLAPRDEELRPLFAILKTRTSHDFSSYKRNTVLRRIERRMVANGASALSDYFAILEHNPGEAQSLCQELLIGVTRFFRDPEAFELLRAKIIPSLFADRDTDVPIRIWHAYCATGEEAYSVAMLVLEHLEKKNLHAKVQIFATDLDEAAVTRARAGLYSDDIIPEVGEERLKHFFVKSENGWQVTKQLREMVVFAHHNLINDPPFSRLDLLVCRNFLIYLKPEIQRLLIPLFHQVLNPNGCLFLGSAETVGLHDGLFTPVDKKWKIFRRQGGERRADALFPFSGSVRKFSDIELSVRSVETQEAATIALADKLLMERYVPARVIINEKNEVVHFSKQAGAYLLTPEGKPTRDLLRIAKEELRPALRAAIYKAFAHQKEIEYRGIKVATDHGEAIINIIVAPLKEPPPADKLALVIIESTAPAPVSGDASEAASFGDDGSRNSLVRHLEEQLRVTGEQLQSTSEQLETSNERFTLANEELMTVNEELQSTNEELQSTNEELITINSELQKKMEELNQSNSDLENLFASSEIATFFLSRKLLIKRFSPAMAAIFDLIPADIGRSVHHLNNSVDWSDLPLDAASVLENLVPIEREVCSQKDGRSFIMRVLPYRTTGGGVDGIVVTLIDISERKRAEVSLRESEKRFRTLADAIPQLAWTAQPDGHIFWYNQRWYDYTGVSFEQMEGWGWQNVHDPLVLPRVMDKWRESLATGEPFDMEFPLRGADGSYRWFLTRVLPLKDANGQIIQWFGTNTDVTEIKEAKDTLRRYELLAGNSRDIILFVRRDDARIVEANAAATEAYGYNHEEMLQLTLHHLRATQKADLVAAQMADADARGILFETIHRRKDDTTFPVEVSSRGATLGNTRMLLSIIRDITERKQAEKAVYEASEQRRLALEAGGLGSWDYNFETDEVLWDEQCRSMWGIGHGNQIGYAAAIDRIHADDRAAAEEAFHQALSGVNGGAYHCEFRVVWLDGSEHWIASHGRVYWKHEGEQRRPIRFVGVNREITARKHAEATRARLVAIVESSEDAIVAKDLNAVIISWNGGAERLFGYRAEEAVGRPVNLLIPPEMQDDECRMMQRLLAGERINHFETVRLTKEGRRIDVSLTMSPIKDDKGRIIGISKVARDITERKRTEATLREARMKLEAALASMTDAVFISDNTGQFIEFNDAFASFHRFANKASCLRRLADYPAILEVFTADGELTPLDMWVVPRALRGETVANAEYILRRKDTGETWVGSYSFSPIRDNQGAVVGSVVVGRDVTELKRKEEALRRSEAQYHTLFATLIEGFCTIEMVFDPEGRPVDYRFLETNPAFERLTGLHDAKGRLMRDLAPDNEQYWYERYGKVAMTGESLRFEGETKALGRCFDVCAYRIGEPEDRRVAILFNDITERKRAEEALKESAVHLNRSQEVAHLGSWELDLSRNELTWSDETYRIFGFQPQEFRASYDAFLEAVHPEDRGAVDAAYSDSVREGKDSYEIEHRIVKKTTGEIRIVHEKFEHFRDASGKIVRSVGMVHDITERKLAEETLRLSEQRRSLALEAAQAGTWEWDLLTNENIWSNELWSLYGLEANSCKPSYEEWRKVAHPDDLEKTEQILHDAILQGIAYNTEWRVNLPDGSERWLMSRGQPLRDQHNRVVRYLGIVMDITERKRAEKEKKAMQAQLMQAQKMEAIGTLAGGIAHDFNNILAAVLGYTEMARDASPAGSAIAHDLDKVLEAGGRASNLVKQILTFSREASIERTPLQPLCLVKEALKLLRPALPSTISIRQRLDAATSPILADPTQVHQIVMNLCTNAFHAMEQTGGVLEITLRNREISPSDLLKNPGMQPGNFVLLSIGDTGPGIPPAIRDKIFEPYFTTKEAGKGTGMGLSIVHGIVAAMGGFITYEGGPGEGSLFQVFFPAVEREVAVVAKPVEKIAAGNERILFIDDEEMLAEMGKIMLERLGYKVTVRTSSVEALATFQNQPDQFDAVITDQTMPGLTGVELARRMLRIRPDIPLILCTGYSNLVNEEQAKAIGIKGFIMKPMTKRDIAQMLRAVLER